MCNACVYREVATKRNDIIRKASFKLGYYRMALKDSTKKNDIKEIQKYDLIVQVLNEIVSAGKYV
ncbi:MAG: hypothetical protein N2645_18775 [Clostridia bacterium]|nr:hypothetical protein [Clostridia bacterium]